MLALAAIAAAGLAVAAAKKQGKNGDGYVMRGQAMKAAACSAWTDGVRETAEIAWVVARAAYPERSWPMRPTLAPLPPRNPNARLWGQIVRFARNFDPKTCE